MKIFYKCEYCDEINENENEIKIHELKCGYNPKNQINDDIILKLSRINEAVEYAIRYILLKDYEDKLDYFYDEFNRATSDNCACSIYNQSRNMKSLIRRTQNIDKKEIDWFFGIVERDNKEFIDAIRTFIKLPQFRIK